MPAKSPNDDHRHAAVNDAAIARTNGQPYDVDDQTGGLLQLAIMKWFYDTDKAEDIVDGRPTRRACTPVSAGYHNR